MSEQESAQVVQQVYDRFNAGDIEGVVNALGDEIDWLVPHNSKVPFSGARHGRDSVAAFFATLPEYMEPKSFDVQGMITQGNRVVAHGHFAWHVKTTGRDYESDFAHIWAVDGGKITRFHEYMDTAAMAAAY